MLSIILIFILITLIFNKHLTIHPGLFLAEDYFHEVVIALAVRSDHHVDLVRDDPVLESVELLQDPHHPDILTGRGIVILRSRPRENYSGKLSIFLVWSSRAICLT